MKWQFNDQRPIYLQIADQIRLEIASGVLQPGERMPSVRELAAEAGVNPNTAQRAMAELERDLLLRSERTAGRFITEDSVRIAALRGDLACAQTDAFLAAMEQLGFDANEAVELLRSRRSSRRQEEE